MGKKRVALAILMLASGVFAQELAVPVFAGFTPGNLVLSRSVYSGDATTVTVIQQLPPVCGTAASCPARATDNGAYPAIGSTNNVFNNDIVDGSFGITSPIFLDQITAGGALISSLPIPGSLVSTSFSSKSELALNLSPDGARLTFMGYVAVPNTVDVSNSNTPGVVDPTNPVGTSFYRAVVQVYKNGGIHVTNTNAYSGNNGRAAIFANGVYYTVGNANNGGGTPADVINSTGVQIVTPFQTAGTPLKVGAFSATQYGFKADKLGKDDNYRGLTVFNNTLYVTKGSGGNGINTVYQVGTPGTLPAVATASNTPITILPGFPVTLAKTAGINDLYPFGIWFANANTLYVADEGDGNLADAAIAQKSGLQKWVLVNGTWHMAYVLRNGLNLGTPYAVPNYPTALNPATDGLRNITGRVNGDGTVTVWGVTSTVSTNGDQGADPNKLVAITDVLANTDPSVAATEQFSTLRTAAAGEVFRGVSFAPTVDELQYDFFQSGTQTPAASLLFHGLIRDFSPASYPIPGFRGFIAPSPASLTPCDMTSNSSGELDCRLPGPFGGIFYYVFNFGGFTRQVGPISGSGFVSPDASVPGTGLKFLQDGQISIAQ